MLSRNRQPSFKRKEAWAGFLFAVPAMTLFLLFAVYPIGRTLYLSFFDYNMLVKPQFIGWGNYQALLGDTLFWQSVRATLFYLLATYVPAIILALALAVALNREFKLRSVFRSLYFTPVVMSMVVVSVIWKLLFNYRGLFNELLSHVDIGPITWLTSSKYAPWALAIMSIWKVFGYYMVIYLAGLQGIPTEIREAAHIDGANSWQTFKNITLPLIRPITVFVITMSVLTGMQEFTAQYVMTGGGPSGATRVLALMIYETGFNFMRMGKASAISVLLFIVLLSAAFCQRQWLGLNDY
jgi:ABC-type sugar transport system permease subunit